MAGAGARAGVSQAGKVGLFHSQVSHPSPLHSFPNLYKPKLGRIETKKKSSLGGSRRVALGAHPRVTWSVSSSGLSSARTTAAPAGVWVPMAAKCWAAGSQAGLWFVSGNGGHPLEGPC